MHWRKESSDLIEPLYWNVNVLSQIDWKWKKAIIKVFDEYQNRICLKAVLVKEIPYYVSFVIKVDIIIPVERKLIHEFDHLRLPSCALVKTIWFGCITVSEWVFGYKPD